MASQVENIWDFLVNELSTISTSTSYADDAGNFRSTLRKPCSKVLLALDTIVCPQLALIPMNRRTYQDDDTGDNASATYKKDITFWLFGYVQGSTGTSDARSFLNVEAEKLMHDCERVLTYVRVNRLAADGWRIDFEAGLDARPVYDFQNNRGWFRMDFRVTRSAHCQNDL